jgi:hypothetical protein
MQLTDIFHLILLAYLLLFISNIDFNQGGYYEKALCNENLRTIAVPFVVGRGVAVACYEY